MAVLTTLDSVGSGPDTGPGETGSAESGPGNITWMPALDGVRGVALIAVLAFHGGYEWARGGYLGVSMFFTLSGFLLTTVVLRSLDADNERATGSLLMGFWARRVRRLAPAQLAVLVGIVVCVAGGALVVSKPTFTGDVIAAVGQMANWRFVATGSDYGALFRSPSPVLHLWSLAVEVQLYLTFPVVLLALARFGHRNVGSLGLFALIVALAALTVTVPMTSSRMYYGTDVRALEFCAGALLAALLTPNGTRPARLRSMLDSRLGSTLLSSSSILGAAALVVAFASLGLDRLRIDHLHLAGVSLASTTVIAAAATDHGPVAAVLRWRPLRLIGTVSYGAYLIHWPLFLALTPSRLGLPNTETFALRIALSLACATALFHLVERPILGRRSGRSRLRSPFGRRRTSTRAGLLPAVSLIAVAVIVTLGVVEGRMTASELAAAVPDFDQARIAVPAPADFGRGDSELGRADDGIGEPDSQPPAVDPSTRAEPASADDGPLRVMVAGDSQALLVAFGLADWLDRSGFEVSSTATNGCGIGRGGRVRYHSIARRVRTDCMLWAPEFAPNLLAFDPDVIVTATGPWDFSDRQIPGDETWRSPGDPVYDDYMARELDAANELLAASGASVVWLTTPQVEAGRLDATRPRYASAEPERSARLNQLITEAAARNGASVVDFAGFLATCPGGEIDPDIRPDGVHLSWAATDMVADWLGPLLYDAMGRTPPQPPLTACIVPAP